MIMMMIIIMIMIIMNIIIIMIIIIMVQPHGHPCVRLGRMAFVSTSLFFIVGDSFATIAYGSDVIVNMITGYREVRVVVDDDDDDGAVDAWEYHYQFEVIVNMITGYREVRS
jgi:hypothetical protein